MPKTKAAKKDSALAIVRDLKAMPNGAPWNYYEEPVRDPGGQVVGYQEARQCLLCYKGAVGKKLRHEKDCIWLRSGRLLRGHK